MSLAPKSFGALVASQKRPGVAHYALDVECLRVPYLTYQRLLTKDFSITIHRPMLYAADDSAVYLSYFDLEKATELVQSALNNMEVWSNRCHLSPI